MGGSFGGDNPVTTAFNTASKVTKSVNNAIFGKSPNYSTSQSENNANNNLDAVAQEQEQKRLRRIELRKSLFTTTPLGLPGNSNTNNYWW